MCISWGDAIKLSEVRVVKCKRCGKEFETDTSRADYCNECRDIPKCPDEEYKKQQIIKNKKACELRKKIKAREVKVKEHHDEIIDIAKKAQELGMSYGQYTAHLRSGQIK